MKEIYSPKIGQAIKCGHTDVSYVILGTFLYV